MARAAATATRARGRATPARARAARPLRFDQRLVLNQYLLGLFGVQTFEELAAGLDDPAYEGWDENNVSRLYHALAARFYNLPTRNPPGPSRDDLLRYDANIF